MLQSKVSKSLKNRQLPMVMETKFLFAFLCEMQMSHLESGEMVSEGIDTVVLHCNMLNGLVTLCAFGPNPVHLSCHQTLLAQAPSILRFECQSALSNICSRWASLACQEPIGLENIAMNTIQPLQQSVL